MKTMKIALILLISFSLSLFACGGGGGGGEKQGSQAAQVPVSAPSITRKLIAVDGPVSGSTVFLDSNFNRTRDASDYSGVTNAIGEVDITFPSNLTGSWTVNGQGKDESTGLVLNYFMAAPFGSDFITPLTTYLAYGWTNAEVVAMFGGSGYNFLKQNPNDYLPLYRAGVKAEFVTRALAQISGSLPDATMSIVNGWLPAVSEAGFVTYCTLSGMTTQNAQAFAKVMADSLASLDSAGLFADTYLVQKTIQDEVIAALSAFANGAMSATALTGSYTGQPLKNLVSGNGATNQVPRVSAQTVKTKTNLAVTIWLSATDADGSIAGYTVVSGPAHGAITVVNEFTGEILYTPNTNFVGKDVFVFRARDNVGALSGCGKVFVEIGDGVILPDNEAEIRLELSSSDQAIAYIPMMFVSGAEYGVSNSNTALPEPVSSILKKYPVGTYPLVFTFKNTAGQYLTGGGGFVQNWDFSVRFFDKNGQVLLALDQDSGWTWEDNKLGGGNLRMMIKINQDGTVVKG